MIDYAIRAHNCIGHPCSIGLDISYTVEGPIALEWNINWGYPGFQRITDTGFMSKAFYDTLQSEYPHEYSLD